jgi:tRNA G18 (ribose-2'-O)-methylase SpoU
VRRRRSGHGDDRGAAVVAIRVNDPADARLADYVGLRDPDLRRQVDRDRGIFIVEGTLAIRALLRSDYRVRSLLVTEAQWEALGAGHIAAPAYIADRSLMAEVCGFDIHRGAVAAADRRELADPADILPDGPAVVAVLEGITDHENLGALFRNAAAFGVAAVLLDPTCADPLYRRSVRVSLGHVLHVAYTRLEPWPDALTGLAARGFTSVALTPHADAEPLDVVAADPPRRVALLLGAEGRGLSEVVLAAADRRVRIPMAPEVDSLNVATAAAIALHRLSPAVL